MMDAFDSLAVSTTCPGCSACVWAVTGQAVASCAKMTTQAMFLAPYPLLLSPFVKRAPQQLAITPLCQQELYHTRQRPGSIVHHLTES